MSDRYDDSKDGRYRAKSGRILTDAEIRSLASEIEATAAEKQSAAVTCTGAGRRSIHVYAVGGLVCPDCDGVFPPFGFEVPGHLPVSRPPRQQRDQLMRAEIDGEIEEVPPLDDDKIAR